MSEGFTNEDLPNGGGVRLGGRARRADLLRVFGAGADGQGHGDHAAAPSMSRAWFIAACCGALAVSALIPDAAGQTVRGPLGGEIGPIPPLPGEMAPFPALVTAMILACVWTMAGFFAGAGMQAYRIRFLPESDWELDCGDVIRWTAFLGLTFGLAGVFVAGLFSPELAPPAAQSIGGAP